jgi:hemerythrin
MSTINWTDDLNIGIESIDEQHRHIVNLVNNLHDTHLRGEISVANTLLVELIEFKVFHCAHEESLLKQSDFPLFKIHKHSHERIINQCLVLLQRTENGEYVVKEALAFLRETLVSHMKGEDADYAIYLRQAQRSGLKRELGLFNSLRRVFG